MIRWKLRTAKQVLELERLAAERLQEVLEPKPENELHTRNGFDGAVQGYESVARGFESVAREELPQPSASPAPVSEEKQPDEKTELAEDTPAKFFGFGDWAAPYWFIGMEPGKAPGENGDPSRIVEAWSHQLGKPELADCREYHRAIGVETWHKEKAKLQTNWRPLMLFLMTALKRKTDNEALRAYQRTRWGQVKNAETCVIDLSGIHGSSLSSDAEREEYLKQRIWAIRRKIILSGHPPKVVLMHGLTAKPEWEEIAGARLEPDKVVEVGSTLFVMTPSPTAYRRKNADWQQLGLQVREQLQSQ